MKRIETAGLLLLLTLLLAGCGGGRVLMLYPADVLVQKDENKSTEHATTQAPPVDIGFTSREAYQLFPNLPAGIGENVDEWLSVAKGVAEKRTNALKLAGSLAYNRLVGFLKGPDEQSYALREPDVKVFRVDYIAPFHMAIVIVSAPKYLNPKHLGEGLAYDNSYWYAVGKCTNKNKEKAEKEAEEQALWRLTRFILNGKSKDDLKPKAVERYYCGSRFDGRFWHVQVALGARRSENPRM